jgi:hypothetical protein
MRPSSVHAVTSNSSLGKLSFSITRLWYLPAVKGLQKVKDIETNHYQIWTRLRWNLIETNLRQIMGSKLLEF